MKNGNWVPICKSALKTLPVDRAFSEVEALFSLTCNYDSKKNVSESGLAKRWGWSRSKVRTFLKKIGVRISYKQGKERNPTGGQVKRQAEKEKKTSLGQVRFINYNNLDIEEDKTRTSSPEKKDKLKNTIIEPNIEPKDLKPIVENPEIPFKEIIDALNFESGKRYGHTNEATRRKIKARWNDGYRLEDFRYVIQIKCREWVNTQQEKYLRPETLFGNKFESYLNQKTIETMEPRATTVHQQERHKQTALFRAYLEDEANNERKNSRPREIT